MSVSKPAVQSKDCYQMIDPLALSRSIPENPPCIVEGLLLDVGTTMLAAKPKCGKSTFLRQLGVCVAEGKPFLGMPTQISDVLLFTLEGPDWIAARHIERLGYTGAHGKIYLMREALRNDGPNRFRIFSETLAKYPWAKLVIVDPAARLTRVKNNDDYAEIYQLTEKFEILAKHHKCQIVFSLHAKKRETDDVGDSAIGSTAYRGSTDCNIFLRKQGNQRIISTEHRSALPWIEPTLLNFDADRQELSLGSTVQSVEESGREHQKRITQERMEAEILAALRSSQTLSTADLLAAAKGMDAKKYEVIAGLEQSGKIQSEKDGKKVLYRIAEIPVEEKPNDERKAA